MLLGNLPKVLAQKPGTALLVKGGPGVGKTEVVLDYYTRQVADHFVAKFVAAQETPESVTGFLWLNQQSGRRKWPSTSTGDCRTTSSSSSWRLRKRLSP